MQVNLFSTYRSHAGEKTFELELAEGTKVGDAVQEILHRFPGLKKHWINKQGALFPHVHICINQVDIDTLPGKLETELSQSDIIDIFPPISGG